MKKTSIILTIILIGVVNFAGAVTGLSIVTTYNPSHYLAVWSDEAKTLQLGEVAIVPERNGLKIEDIHLSKKIIERIFGQKVYVSDFSEFSEIAKNSQSFHFRAYTEKSKLPYATVTLITPSVEEWKNLLIPAKELKQLFGDNVIVKNTTSTGYLNVMFMYTGTDSGDEISIL